MTRTSGRPDPDAAPPVDGDASGSTAGASTAARITVAEVEHLVPAGELDPDHIHTPAVFVKRLFCGAPYDKKIEQRTIRKA